LSPVQHLLAICGDDQTKSSLIRIYIATWVLTMEDVTGKLISG